MLRISNTFAINVFAEDVIEIFNESSLITQWRKARAHSKPVLILGGGCNVLFLENYSGIILLNRIKDIKISESIDFWHLHIGSGEIWHELVIYSLKHNMPGLENLAFIPGYVGAAPIHNIGAYGVELQDFCEYVDIIQLDSGKKMRFNNDECKFSYRNSIFKHISYMNSVIVAVGLKLSKVWQPILNYGTLRCLDKNKTTPYQVFDIIHSYRSINLPDINLTGNAGSFFKNPIVEINVLNKLLKCYPNMPYYIQSDGRIKLSAGWLIDYCQLKGYRLGNAAVYNNQALVLINYNQQATGIEIARLACYVQKRVANIFSIVLEPEVRLIAACGEVNNITDFI